MLLSWLKNNPELAAIWLATVTVGLNIVVGIYYVLSYHQPIAMLWLVVLVVLGIALSVTYAVLAGVLNKKHLAINSVIWAVYTILNASFPYMAK